MSAPDSKPRTSAAYIGPGQQQPRQVVCWSNTSIPSECTKKEGGVHGPESDEHEAQPSGARAPSMATRLSFLGSSSSKLRENLRCSKRRLLQQILVKLNHADVSDDTEYQALRDRQLELLERVAALTTHVKSFATNLVALGHGSSLIGNASAQIAVGWRPPAFSVAGAAGRLGTGGSNNSKHDELARRPSSGFGASSFDSDFPKNMLKLESHARELAGVVLTTIAGSLEKKLQAMTALKKEMDERENLKLDFDSAQRKLRLVKQRGKAEAIVRRDVKLQTARNALTVATEAVAKKFQYYESARPVLVYHELRQFRELQTQFFSLCVSSFQMREQLSLGDDDDDDAGNDRNLHGAVGRRLSASARKQSVALSQ